MQGVVGGWSHRSKAWNCIWTAPSPAPDRRIRGRKCRDSYRDTSFPSSARRTVVVEPPLLPVVVGTSRASARTSAVVTAVEWCWKRRPIMTATLSGVRGRELREKEGREEADAG